MANVRDKPKRFFHLRRGNAARHGGTVDHEHDAFRGRPRWGAMSQKMRAFLIEGRSGVITSSTRLTMSNNARL